MEANNSGACRNRPRDSPRRRSPARHRRMAARARDMGHRARRGGQRRGQEGALHPHGLIQTGKGRDGPQRVRTHLHAENVADEPRGVRCLQRICLSFQTFRERFLPHSVKTSLLDLASLICRGGWPGGLELDDHSAKLVPMQYLDALISKQDDDAPGSPQELMRFLQSLACNIGSAVTQKTLAKDMGADPKDREALDR